MKILYECNGCYARFYEESEFQEFQVRVWKAQKRVDGTTGYWDTSVEKLCKKCVATKIGSGRYGS